MKAPDAPLAGPVGMFRGRVVLLQEDFPEVSARSPRFLFGYIRTDRLHLATKDDQMPTDNDIIVQIDTK